MKKTEERPKGKEQRLTSKCEEAAMNIRMMLLWAAVGVAIWAGIIGSIFWILR